MGCSDIVFFAVGNTNHCDDVGDCTLGRGQRIIISCDWDNLYMVFFKKIKVQRSKISESSYR